MEPYDVLVIGGGAAGLSAALVLCRARRRVVVVDAGEPRNAPASHMHGFLSRDGMPPRELLSVGRQEVREYGGSFLDGRVSGASRLADSRFQVRLDDGQRLEGRSVVVATGLRDRLPDIPGVRERWGRDLLHCPYCHGYEVRDGALAVLGGSSDSVQHAQLIRQWSADLLVFPHTDELTEAAREELHARGIGIVEGPVKRLLVDDDRLAGIELEDGRVIARSAVFVRPQFVPNASVLIDLGCFLDAAGWVAADAVGRTSEPGVWVSGNAANPRAQVITAAGEGSATAIALNAELIEQDIQNAVLEHRRGSDA